MTRARVKRLRRNLAVAIGNSRDTEAAAALMADRAHVRPDAETLAEPLVAEHVDWARGRQ
jgi:epoxyqueuosine reductase QueG